MPFSVLSVFSVVNRFFGEKRRSFALDPLY